jgi:hypothetical protein
MTSRIGVQVATQHENCQMGCDDTLHPVWPPAIIPTHPTMLAFADDKSRVDPSEDQTWLAFLCASVSRLKINVVGMDNWIISYVSLMRCGSLIANYECISSSLCPSQWNAFALK